ncbi:NgoFVII family restriction endonuclease [Patescibacteria group bacterium]|nr:NgoFVII family restriction endonuclease [Patescibacteria group bacterium]
MPKNIITTPEQKFSMELKKELKDAKKAKFAVGWFFISGFKELKDELDKLENLELLISPTTNKHTAETMLVAEKFDEEVIDKLKEIAEYKTSAQKQEILEKEAEAFLERTGKIKPSKESKEFLVWLASKLNEKKIKIRIYTKETMHAKMYLIEKKDKSRVAFMGSSNISISGFNLNTELNIRIIDEKQIKKLSKWFKEKWDKSKDCDFTVLAGKKIEDSWAINNDVTPFRIYLRILHDIFSLEQENEEQLLKLSDDAPELYNFQKDAVIDVYRRLNKYGGIFLADVPGLGKTYMGSALLAHLQEDGEKAVVICPPKLEEHWKDVLDDFNVNARVISRGKLSDIINNDRLMQRDIILIDEAHHFRNPETNGYKDLELICENKKVILVGATPQNLSLNDIYHQMKLFHPREICEQIKIDPPILKDFFEEAMKEREKLDKEGKINVTDCSENLFQQILVRRTRKNIIDEYGKENLPPFPDRMGPYRIDYNIDEVYPGGVYSQLNNKIDQLKFARYDIGSFIEPDQFTDDEKQRLRIAGRNLKSIMHMILFKILESSVVAFRESTNLIYRSHQLFLRGLDEGKVLAGEAADKAYKDLKNDIEIEEIDIPTDSYDGKRFKKDELRQVIEKDMEIFKEMHEMVKDIKPSEDDKLQTLIKRIKGEYKKDNWDKEGKEKLSDKKILIFTQYATTAKYLGEELKKHFSNVDYVSGATGKILTRAALFSPNFNKRTIKRRGIKVTNTSEINILVSTELMSEGMNLQDGQVVINYELHWNPVRIIQRIGRIDRIGSENDKIWVYNFFPQTEADDKINVKEKVKKRINEINTRFGSDAKVISQEEQLSDKHKFYKIYTEDKKSLEEEERESKSSHHRLNWVKSKRELSNEYQKALALPTQSCCGMKKHKEGVISFYKVDDFYKLFFGNKSGEVMERNDWEILSILECKPDEEKLDIHDYHFDVAEEMRQQFEKEANDNEQKKSEHLEKVKRQALSKLQKISRRKSEKDKRLINEVEGLVRDAKLDVKQKRQLRGVIRQKHGLKDMEIVEEIKEFLKNCETIERKPLKKRYAEVIISESLK